MPEIDQLTNQPIGEVGATMLPDGATDSFTFTCDTDSLTVTVSGTTNLVVSDNRLDLVNGTNAQELRIYKEDDGAGNEEWLGIDVASGEFLIGGGKAGTGGNVSTRLTYGGLSRVLVGVDVRVNSRLLPEVNNTSDLGASTLRWRDLYLSGDISATGLPTSDPAVAGQVWNDSGTLKISAG